MVTSAGEWNGGGSRLWECPATGVCIENCTGAEPCEGYPYPSAENGNNYTIDIWVRTKNADKADAPRESGFARQGASR